MLGQLFPRAQGRAALKLQNWAAARLPELAETLVSAGVALWASEGFFSYDEGEENHTVQLYRWMSVAQRGDPTMALLSINLEWLQVTEGILSGRESVRNGRRPDLRISVGQAGISVECKRLCEGPPWCQNYVSKGLARFVLESYGATESLGLMVGYVQSGDPDALLQSENGYIARHPVLSRADVLTAGVSVPPLLWRRSRHVSRREGPIEIKHAWIEIAAGVAGNSQNLD